MRRKYFQDESDLMTSDKDAIHKSSDFPNPIEHPLDSTLTGFNPCTRSHIVNSPALSDNR